jgi:hypothetical protein
MLSLLLAFGFGGFPLEAGFYQHEPGVQNNNGRAA